MKTTHACIAAAGLALAGLVLAGCISSAPTVVEKQGEKYKVTANSVILQNHLKVVERSVRKINDFLEVQIRGQNVTRKDVQFEYRFIWLDEDGIELDSAMSTWKPMALHAKEEAVMKGMASTKDAVDFLMEVRFVSPSTRWR